MSSRTVYTGLPIHWQSAIRHFPGLGILTKIVQPWATTGIHSPQSNLPRQGIEHTMDLAFVQPVSVLIHKQVCLRWQAEAVVSAFQVIG
jgi:hypothetical protein